LIPGNRRCLKPVLSDFTREQMLLMLGNVARYEKGALVEPETASTGHWQTTHKHYHLQKVA